MNIIDYINKYGDTTLEEKDLTQIDKLLFSLLSYVKFDGTVSTNSKDKRTLKKVGESYFKVTSKKEIKNQLISIRIAIDIFDKIRTKKRYENLLLYNDIYIGNDSQQFSAVCIEINPNLVYVSYEGTDQLVSGWKEDCKLSYEYPVEAQKQAIKYLNKHFLFRSCKLIVGGHSKGGNLALVASMNCNSIVKNRIEEVYSYDGPGLREAQIESYRYRKIKKKYTHIIPNYSLFGLLLRHDNDYKVIKANKKGIMAHSASSWLIDDDKFIEAKLSTSSKIFEVGVSNWLNKYNDHQRRLFVKYFFELFEKNNIISFMEFTQNYKLILEIIKEAKDLDPIVKNMTKDLIKMLVDYNVDHIKSKITGHSIKI